MYLLLCAAVLLAGYLLQSTTITVFYHRGLAHRAVDLHPFARRALIASGIWITGLDPKGWVCMHRRHHRYSDTEEDPHSPRHSGFFRLIFQQLQSYERTLVGLTRGEEAYCGEVDDLDFGINRLNELGLWFVPYAVHAAFAVALGLATGMWLLGLCYWLGMMSHPVFGWAVNSFGHAVGGRNFDTPDDSRNNLPAAWIILGEGLQNNHHAYPASAKFSTRPVELDLGWHIARGLEALGVLRIEWDLLIPEVTPEASPARQDRAA